jgi:hypothetical protein
MAEKETVPVCIREMTDAQVLEAQLVENLQRQDVHPLHEAQVSGVNYSFRSTTTIIPDSCWNFFLSFRC